MPVSRSLFIAALLATLVLVGCGGGSSSSGPDELNLPTTPSSNPPPSQQGGGGGGTQTVLDQNRTLWQSQGILNYTYRCQRSIFGPSTFTDPVTVTVQGGQVTSQVYEQTGQPVDPQYSNWWPSIEGLFDILQQAYDAPADSITVTYDPNLGYPTFGSIDPVSGLADDEHAFNASNVVPQ